MSSRKSTENNERSHHDESQSHDNSETIRTSSMGTLIIWNINKAMEKNPAIQLMAALNKAHHYLENDQINVSAIISQRSDERHLSCALLAWQQLGHYSVDSLYNFVMAKRKEESKPSTSICKTCGSSKNLFITHKESDFMKTRPGSSVVSPPAMGPVLKLPATPKVVMPVYNVQGCGGLRKTGLDIKNRIEKACCLESGCVERLVALDKETKELRLRLGKLARREAERIELLERAETAWRDLEMGYMRRLRACVEKEQDIARQSSKLIDERNNSKEICSKLVQVLKPRGQSAEQARDVLKKLESDVCARACERLKHSEMSAKEDAILTDLQCSCNHQERDIQFKEEQARRKLLSLESELESMHGLSYESERTLRAELKAFKDQLQSVSKELFAENEAIKQMKTDRNELLLEKQELIEDLEGCQNKCDKNMQNKVNELKTKRLALLELKDKVMDCRCKLPIDSAVQVKRTPSLAALCSCSPEDKALKSCSCTSLRSRLLCDLFSNLFGGLQYEMGDTSIRMPCQLLKCLEDSHNWDKASVTKTNLRSYFANLLCGELDIAIANSIEKYHAMWVGASCADKARPIPDLEGPDTQGWEDRALARKAHWMAEAMAEQMFNEKVNQIMDQAKSVVAAGPPPCQCNAPAVPDINTAIYQCLVEPVMVTEIEPTTLMQSGYDTTHQQNMHTINTAPIFFSAATNTPRRKTPVIKKETKSPKEVDCHSRTYWQRTQNDVIMLRAQIEGLKKDSIKKQDLKTIEKNIKKLVQRASGPDAPPEDPSPDKENEKLTAVSKTMENNSALTKNKNKKKTEKPKIRRQYAVNMCFCGLHRNSAKSGKYTPKEVINENSGGAKHKNANVLSQITIKQSKPIKDLPSKEETTLETKASVEKTEHNLNCGSNCACFNKIPSCSSIDKFLDTLTKWKYDINDPHDLNHDGLLNTEIKSKNVPDDCSFKVHDVSATICHSIVTKDTIIESNILKKTGNEIKKINDYILESNLELPATISEYMGAVNLEKSTENCCKCTVNKEKGKYSLHHSFDSKKNVQCKSSCKCKPKLTVTHNEIANEKKIKSEEYYDRKEKSPNQRLIKSEEFYIPKKYDNICSQKKIAVNDSFPSCQNEIQDEVPKEVVPVLATDEYYKQIKEQVTKNKELSKQVSLNKSKTNQDNNLNAPDVFKCSCDYQIKLLGVTLADTNPNSNSKSRFKQSDKVAYLADKNAMKENSRRSEVQLQEAEILPQIEHEENIINSLKSFPSKSMENYNLFKSNTTETDIVGLKDLLGQCNVKFDKLKHFINNGFEEKGNIKEDKALDTNSFTDGLLDEKCVCCVNSVEEFNDLEENMFHLLKEHLRKKLQNLKNTDQSLYYIQPDEEAKMLTRIFKKIKQTVNESTGKLECKCEEDVKKEGSWQRAYNLLQEYLKIKINRVKCTCSSLGESNEQNIIPELTDKVCLLIEKDFERLKNISKFKSNDASVLHKSSLHEVDTFQMPEKDMNVIHYKRSDQSGCNSLKKSFAYKELPKSYVIVTNNIAAQVIPSVETKSCDAFKTNDLNKNTVETQSSINCSPLRTTCSIDCNLLDAAKIINSQSTQYSNCEQNLNVIVDPLESTKHVLTKFKELEIELKSWDNQSERKKNTSLPYIGQTIDCTCTPNLGFCVCSKSRAIENKSKINELWKTYTNTEKDNTKLYYIMKNVSQKDVHNSNSSNLIRNSMSKMRTKHVTMTDINTSTRGVGVITLKDSREHVNKQSKHGGTNTEDIELVTFGTNFNTDDKRYEPEREVKDKTHENKNKKSVHFLHRSRSETISKDKLPELIYPGCDCSKVPVCHVKMLVENIENKIANSECTCDSLSSKVCPVHSKKVE